MSDQSSSKEQYLFLLEFFVHYITGERVSKLNETLRGPTSILLQFLGIQNDAIEITPAHQQLSPLARPAIGARDVEKFYSGRSILFAIPQTVVVNKNAEFKINLRVYKKMPADIHPDVLIGTGELDITNEFTGLRKEMFDCWNCDVPPPKNYEGPVEIYHNNQLAAFVLAYVRISSFGQSIVTAFDAPATKTGSFIFRSEFMDQEALAYNCRLISQSLFNLKARQRSNLQLDPPFCRENYCPHQDGGDKDSGGENKAQARGFESPAPFSQPLVLKVSGMIDQEGNFNDACHQDADFDVFVLRIGKKGLVGEEEKSDIQIELRTPKALVDTLPVRCETREIQTEAEEAKFDEEILVRKTSKKKKQKLFLIEFLVDRVSVPTVRAMHDEFMPAKTCVSFKILSLPAVNIYQEDPVSGARSDNFFRKGKSCLFALPNLVLEKPLHTFPVTLSVYKKLPAGVLPDVMHIGAHQIEMKELMNGLLREHVFRGSDASKSLKNTYTIETATGQVVGNVTVFIRTSCFGKKLVTQFEIPHNRKPYLFKSLDDSSVFECQRISSSVASPGFSGKKSTSRRDNIDARNCQASRPLGLFESSYKPTLTFNKTSF
ncbi:Protein of unknown function [Cotesia congregata]|uniref:Uncharacterized protein n=1 Tax=Cotesia congregata TaxID=51543 RepID=A0A8J2H7Q5_COTCN|nr:Protein of unknown function [Cotesia congregata]